MLITGAPSPLFGLDPRSPVLGLWYATRVYPASSLAAARFLGASSAARTTPTQDAETRLLSLWSVIPKCLRLAAAHSGLPGRRKTAYQVA